MADIKTKDSIKGMIKMIDKAAITEQRMKRAYVQTKEKAEYSRQFKEKQAAETLKNQSVRTPRSKGVKAVEQTEKTVKQSARSSGKKQ